MKEQFICDKLMEVLKVKSYDKIKVSEFAAYAKISRSTFYFYYDSIDAVMDYMEDKFIGILADPANLAAGLASGMPKGQRAGIEVVQETCRKMYKYLSEFKVLSGPNGRPQFQRKLYARILQINTTYYGVANVPKHYLEVTSEFFAGAQWRIFRWWAEHDREVSASEMAEYILNIFQSMQAPTGRTYTRSAFPF